MLVRKVVALFFQVGGGALHPFFLTLRVGHQVSKCTIFDLKASPVKKHQYD